MQYRTLGNTGLRVSVIGLGCAGLRNPHTDYAVQIIHRALECGINYFDNAKGYGDAEIKMGIALEGRRDEAIISTKTGAKTRDDAWRDIESSLKRLRVDYVDNFHLHALSSEEDINQRLGPDGALQALIEAKEQGLTRHIGCTSHRHDLLIEALRRFDFEIVLAIMNFMSREPMEELIPLCIERGVGFTVMKGLGKGLLPVDLALKWLLNQPVHCVVPGALSPEEIEQSARVGHGDLTWTAEDAARVAAVENELGSTYCSVCGLCLPCPANIRINVVLGTDEHLYGYRAYGRDGFRDYPWSLDYVADNWQARAETIAAIEACTRCGICEERCPRGLPVMDLLQRTLPTLREILSVYRDDLRLGQ
ncbi:MAG: hypothetical protein GX552_13910 [Chloroflexi bacterium]|jgi:predicted aldo/keto reductase-like oxidoreductase|nr:hypothetical protein [Chloroflexota bacterium]